MEIHQKNIDSLIFAEYNPRQLTSEQYQQLKDSITRFGIVDPIIVNINKERRNIIVGGHQRVKVAKKMGIEEVPCILVNLSYEKERELNVRLNKNTGAWDFDVLADHFDINELLEWGFSNDELELFEEPLFDELIAEDKEKPLEIKIKLKDVNEFELCIKKIEDVLKDINGATYSVSGGEV